MKVKELIEKLETLPQDATVWSWDYHGKVNYDIKVSDELDEDGEIGVRAF